jgi:pyrroloquinoline quinone biosynthesis protein D
MRFDQTRECHVLMLPERVVMLSESAAEILSLCDGARTVPELISELQRRYPEAELEADIREFLGEAVERKWLERPTKT